MVSTAGLPVALSKTISEANALGRRNQVRRVFSLALVAFLVLGTVSSLVMFRFAGPLAAWQGDSLAVYAVKALALSCLFVCAMSAFRGYAQGHSNMVPTAVSQIIEALFKLVVGLALAWYLVKIGKGSEISAAGAIFGVTASGLFALLYLIFSHLRRQDALRSRDVPDSSGSILANLARIAIPITLSASIQPITSYLDTVQVQTRLQDVLGMTESAAVSLYGAYQKAITIYNLPPSFMVALAASVIPAVSAACARRDRKGAGKLSESALRMAVLVAFPAGIGLTVLASPVMKLLYSTTNLEVAGPALAVLGIASIFVCVMIVCNSILQANGFVNLPIIVMFLGSIVKLSVNYYLVGKPEIGIKGAPVGTLLCFAIIALLELVVIKRVVPYAPRYGRVFLKPLAAALVMGAAVRIIYSLLSRLLSAAGFITDAGVLSRTGNALGTFLSIGAGMIIYFALVLLLKAISREDLEFIPKGDRIAKFLHISK